MAARTDGVRGLVAGVRGSTVADANALDHSPAAASTAPRASTEGGTLEPDAWDMSADTMASVADSRCSTLVKGHILISPAPYVQSRALVPEPRHCVAMPSSRTVEGSPPETPANSR